MITPQYSLTDLQDLSSSAPYYQMAASNENIREQAVSQAAEALGMQAGLAAESKQIDSILKTYDFKLDQIFDFNLVMYQNNVLPPVIVEDNNAMSVNAAGDAVRIGGVTYKMLQQIRFVTAPPTWRDYLWLSYPEPTLPNKVLLPTNATETAIWKQALTDGWNQGIAQAIGIYKIDLNRLVQDYTGMVMYKKLLVMNMISPYYVNKQNLGVTGNSTEMVVDDQSWQIANKPALQTKSSLWHPVILHQDSRGGE